MAACRRSSLSLLRCVLMWHGRSLSTELMHSLIVWHNLMRDCMLLFVISSGSCRSRCWSKLDSYRQRCVDNWPGCHQQLHVSTGDECQRYYRHVAVNERYGIEHNSSQHNIGGQSAVDYYCQSGKKQSFNDVTDGAWGRSDFAESLCCPFCRAVSQYLDYCRGCESKRCFQPEAWGTEAAPFAVFRPLWTHLRWLHGIIVIDCIRHGLHSSRQRRATIAASFRTSKSNRDVNIKSC